MSLLDEYNLEVHDVGSCWAGNEELSDFTKEIVRIVIFEISYGVETERSRLLNGISVYNSTSRVRRAVCAVRSC